jgi:hypothetical protein
LQRPFAVILLAAAIAGCGLSSPDPQILEFAKQYFEAIRTRDFETIERTIDPPLKNERLRPTIEKMSRMFPAGQPKAIDVITWRWKGEPLIDPKRRIDRYELRLKYDYPERSLLADFVTDKKGGQIQVKGFHVRELDKQALEQNAFTLRNKPVRSLLFLAYAVAVPAFILVTLILCIRSPIRWRWKWLWLIFISLGVGKVTLNWANGALLLGGVARNLSPGATTSFLLNVTLLGSEYIAIPLGPILIGTSLPLGAIVFLLVRRRWRNAAGTPPPATPAPPDPH